MPVKTVAAQHTLAEVTAGSVVHRFEIDVPLESGNLVATTLRLKNVSNFALNQMLAYVREGTNFTMLYSDYVNEVDYVFIYPSGEIVYGRDLDSPIVMKKGMKIGFLVIINGSGDQTHLTEPNWISAVINDA